MSSRELVGAAWQEEDQERMKPHKEMDDRNVQGNLTRGGEHKGKRLMGKGAKCSLMKG